jgi:hypothetical protein
VTSTTLADFERTGFPNQFLCDSWVVGFWRGRPWKPFGAILTYDPMVDFRPVIEYGNYPVAIMAAALLQVKALAEFAAFSKDSKGGVLVGIPGAGSVSHIYGQLLQQKTVARLTFIPYRGDAPARVDLLAGNILAIAATPDFGLGLDRRPCSAEADIGGDAGDPPATRQLQPELSQPGRLCSRNGFRKDRHDGSGQNRESLVLRRAPLIAAMRA